MTERVVSIKIAADGSAFVVETQNAAKAAEELTGAVNQAAAGVQKMQGAAAGVKPLTNALDESAAAATRSSTAVQQQAQKTSAAAAQTVASASRIGQTVQQQAQQVTTAATQTVAAMNAVSGGAKTLVDAHDLSAAAAARSAAAADRASAALERLAERAAVANTRTVRSATQVGATVEQLGKKVEVSAGQTAAAMRMLPAQMTDVVTQLAGGASPMLVLIQQGGQVKDSFGGIGNTLRALGSLITPVRVAMTGVAVALAAVTLAYAQGSTEVQGYARALAMSNNAAGQTVSQMSTMAERVSAVAGTQAKAAEAISALVATGRVAGSEVEQLAQTVVAAERSIGESVEDTVANFAELGKAPVEASLRLNEGLNYLTEGTYKQIKAAQDLGRTEEAASIAQRAYADALKTRANEIDQNLGSIERGWKAVKDIASAAWDAMLGIGRQRTISDQLDDVTKKIAERMQRGPLNSTPGMQEAFQRGLQVLRDEQAALQEKLRLEGRAAAIQAAAVERDRARIALARELESSATQQVKLANDLARANALADKAQASPEERAKLLAQVRAKHAELANKAAAEALVADKITLDKQLAQYESYQAESVRAYEQTNKDLDALRERGMISEVQYLQAKSQAALQLNADNRAVAELERDAVAASAQSAKDKATAQNRYNAELEKLKAQEIDIVRDTERAITTVRVKESQDRNKKLATGQGAQFQRDIATVRAAEDALRNQRESAELLQLELSLMTESEEVRETALAQRRIALQLERDILEVKAKQLSADGEEAAIALLREKAQLEASLASDRARLQTWKSSVREYDDIFRKGFAAMLNRGDGSFKAWTKSLATTFKTSVADAIYEFLAKPFVVSLVGSFLGLSGSAASAAAGGGILGTTGNLFNTITGAKNVYEMYGNYQAGLGAFGGSGTLGSYVTGASSIAPWTQAAANASGDAIGFLAGAQGWTPGVTNMAGFYVGGGALAGSGVAAGTIGSLGTGTAMMGGVGTGTMLTGLGGAGAGAAGAGVAGSGVTTSLGAGFYSSTAPAWAASTSTATGIAAAAPVAEAGTAAAATPGLMTNPYGWVALAVIAAIALLSGKGEKRSGGQYELDFDSEGKAGEISLRAGPSGGEVAGDFARDLITGTTQGINTLLKDMGSSMALTGFQAGLETSGKGRGGVYAGGTLTGGVTFGESGQGNNYEGTMFERTSTQSPDAETVVKNFALDLKQATVQALQAATDIPETIKAMVKDVNAEELTDETATALLTAIQTQVDAVNGFRDTLALLPFAELKDLSFDAATALVNMAGGLDKLNASLTSYYNNYYSEAERTEVATVNMRTAFKDLGLEMPDLSAGADKAKAQLRLMVEATDSNTEAGRKQWTGLMALQQAFSDLAKATETLAGKTDEAAEAAKAAAAAEEARAEALKLAQDATDAALSAVMRAVEAERNTVSAAQAAAQEMLQQAQSVGNVATQAVRTLFGSVAETVVMSAAQGQSFIANAMSTAQRTGYLPESEALSEAVNAAVAGIDAKQYASKFEEDRDRLVLASRLEALKTVAGQQQTVAQRQLTNAEAQLRNLDQIARDASNQVDSLRGIDTSIKSVAEAVKALASAIAKESKAAGGTTTTGGTGSAGQGGSGGGASGSSAYDPGNGLRREFVGADGSSSWIPVWDIAEASRLADLKKAYSEIPDTTDLAGRFNAVKAAGGTLSDLQVLYGFPLDDLRKAAASVGVPAFAKGGFHAGGLRWVGEQGPELEATGPSRIWNSQQLGDALRSGGSSDSEVRLLRQEMQVQAAATAAYFSRMARMLEQWDGEGMPKERKETVA